MNILKLIKSNNFILHFLFYNIIIFIISFSSISYNMKLLIMIIGIIECFYIVYYFKKIGFYISIIYNSLGIISLFFLFNFTSLYHNAIMSFLIISIVASIFIYKFIISNDKYKNELLKLSRTDQLCNIYNNRYYTEIIIKEISRAKRTNTQLGLLIFDIDHFKKINDSFGHYKGDLVLKTFANKISKIIRTEDTFFRYGGDEFIIIITNYNSHTLEKVFERINDTLNNINTTNLFSINTPITISLGLAIYPDEAENETELFKKADIFLYESKKYEGTILTSRKKIIN